MGLPGVSHIITVFVQHAGGLFTICVSIKFISLLKIYFMNK